MHKLAPALAAGNAVVLKPARATPLTALALAECFVDAGLPDGVLSVLTGAGGELGDALVSDPRVNKVSFTGSTGVGHRITQLAGVKKLSLELGASCPVVVLPDADVDAAAAAVAIGGYVNAGQVCISVQRVITHPTIAADFLDALVARVEKIQTGDPRSADTGMGTLITVGEVHAHRWDRIRINGLNIGWSATDGENLTQRQSHGADADWQQRAAATLPMGKLGQVDEIADFVAFLLSDRSGVVTGSVIDWDQNVIGGLGD